MLPEEIKPAMLGAIPSTMVTCSLAGVPNVTAISQVWYVDETHVALSFQFFSKTHRNVRENPFAEVIVRDGQNFQEWHLEIQYDHSEETRRISDAIHVNLHAIASIPCIIAIF